MGATRSVGYFEMKDPINDEHGYGSYQYPSNIAFKPYQGLFDIIEFKVLPGEAGLIYFDTRFAKITNPWVAPEGFIHENIRIFINKQPNQGLTVLPYPGANIKFNPKYGWEVCLRIVGWGNSQLLTLEDHNIVRTRSLKVELLSDHQTIRASVPEQYIGTPLKSWHYYVLVGSYDGFGEDFFRKIATKSGEWVIGGGNNPNIEPRVLDLLASKNGPHNQEKQLRSFDPQTGQLAELYPVGSDTMNINPVTCLYVCLILLFISGVTYLITKKPSRISWFWVSRENKAVKD
jgi:carbohydrate-binding DOMON domain-containing protein